MTSLRDGIGLRYIFLTADHPTAWWIVAVIDLLKNRNSVVIIVHSTHAYSRVFKRCFLDVQIESTAEMGNVQGICMCFEEVTADQSTNKNNTVTCQLWDYPK
jgi:hypothetical protein